MFATEATAEVWVLGADLQDVFQQEAFPPQRAPTHLTQKTLSESPPFVDDGERRPSPSLFSWWRQSLAFPPVAVWIFITVH